MAINIYEKYLKGRGDNELAHLYNNPNRPDRQITDPGAILRDINFPRYAGYQTSATPRNWAEEAKGRKNELQQVAEIMGLLPGSGNGATKVQHGPNTPTGQAIALWLGAYPGMREAGNQKTQQKNVSGTQNAMMKVDNRASRGYYDNRYGQFSSDRYQF